MARAADAVDVIYNCHLNELRRDRSGRSCEPYARTHRPWSELTNTGAPSGRPPARAPGRSSTPGSAGSRPKPGRMVITPTILRLPVVVAAPTDADVPRRVRSRTRS